MDNPRCIWRGTQNHSGPPTVAPADGPRSPRWRSIATPGRRYRSGPTPDNPDAEAGVLIRLLYEDLVEVEALAVTADEAVTNLPPRPRGKYGKTLARLYTLVGKTSGTCAGRPGAG